MLDQSLILYVVESWKETQEDQELCLSTNLSLAGSYYGHLLFVVAI